MSKNYKNLMAGLAAYIPASPPGYATFPVRPPKKGERPLPAGLIRPDMNFLTDAGDLLFYDKALMSAALALGNSLTRIPSPMITDLKSRLLGTMVLWDSGGFSFRNKGAMDDIRSAIKYVLPAQEYYADVAATLDIIPIYKNPNFPDFRSALEATVENLHYYNRYRRGGAKPIFLNVLHGNTPEECDTWDKSVRWFPAGGWAFGTLYKKSLKELLRRIIILLHDHMMDGRSWLHLFGTSRLALTCALTTIQTELSNILGRPITVSYDSSTPFSMVYGSRMAFLGYSIDKSGMAMRQHRFPNWDQGGNLQDLDFPSLFPSAIANRLTMADICLSDRGLFGTSSWDDTSYHLIAHHNLEVLLNAIIAAHRVYLLDESNAAALCPEWLIRTRIGIKEVLNSETPMDMLEKYSGDFAKVRNGGRAMSAAEIDNDDDDDTFN